MKLSVENGQVIVQIFFNCYKKFHLCSLPTFSVDTVASYHIVLTVECMNYVAVEDSLFLHACGWVFAFVICRYSYITFMSCYHFLLQNFVLYMSILQLTYQVYVLYSKQMIKFVWAFRLHKKVSGTVLFV